MRTLVLAACALLALVPTANASGQAGGAPSKGSWGFRFNLPEGGGAGLGAAHFITEQTNLGLDIVFAYSSSEDERVSNDPDASRTRGSSRWEMRLSPEVRRYILPRRVVRPFLTAGLTGAYASTNVDVTDGTSQRTQWRTMLEAGVGAEWFPTESVGFSGSTGIQAEYRRADQDDPEGQGQSSRWRVNAFRSALFLTLYF